jgi:hypothetical protein
LKAYSIRIRGQLDPASLDAFPEMAVRKRGEDSVLMGLLPDSCALFGIVAEIEASGLELIEIRCLSAEPDSEDPGSEEPIRA